MEVDESALVGGQPVVDEHLDPVAKVPEPEPEHAAVAVLKVLLGRIPMTQVSVYVLSLLQAQSIEIALGKQKISP